MRWLLVIGLVACGCEGGKGGGVVCRFNGTTFLPNEEFPAGDGCNSCFCSETGQVSCTERACQDGGVDADPTSCIASGGCTNGPVCGARCCNSGERCDNGACVCGLGPACSGTDFCVAAGPIGSDGCGTVCCGESSPCPQ